MPDLYTHITDVEIDVQKRLAEVLELRAADPQQQAMLQSYLAAVPFPPGARVLEVGCGTGAIARQVARHPAVGSLVGIDPSPLFLEIGRGLAADLPDLTFEQGSALELPFGAASFDVVMFHTSLCHVPEPARALSEAYRVLRRGGRLSVFDGDYNTTSLAIGDYDPLQSCADMVVESLVNDPWLVRRLQSMVRAAGFRVSAFRSYGYAEIEQPRYMFSNVERGADYLVAAGRIGAEAANALKAEARRRVESGEFFGFIAYAAMLAERPEA